MSQVFIQAVIRYLYPNLYTVCHHLAALLTFYRSENALQEDYEFDNHGAQL